MEKKPAGREGSSTQKRRSAEERAAERELLSTKLTNLLDSATTPAGAGDAASEPDSGPQTGVAGSSRRERRKREIFGRAISNVSAASSGSIDSAAPRRDAKAGGAATRGDDDGAGLELSFSAETAEPTAPPPATQLEWRDPSAEKYREAVMRRLMSADGAGNPSTQRANEAPGISQLQGSYATRRQTRSRP